MRVLVNALSVTNLSGRHVLLGHLERLANWTRGEHEFQVLHHAGNQDIVSDLGGNVDWVECPSYTAGWMGRSAWEIRHLGRVARSLKSDFTFTPAGTVVPGLRLPQVVFAQNPWALVKGLKRSPTEWMKATMQRRSYADAVKESRLMFFNSRYMRGAYRDHAGAVERDSEIVYQGIDDSTHARAATDRNSSKRERLQILCVSAMARHKDIETLVQALAIVHADYKIPASLVLVGAWPDADYERTIRSLIEKLGMSRSITLKGHVARPELDDLYARSRVFSLTSRCESFGIPAVEAQAFGTPVVNSNCCAVPEVCGNGGLFPEPGNIEETAGQLARLLDDDILWAQLSVNARENASKYRWDICSRPLLRMFDGL